MRKFKFFIAFISLAVSVEASAGDDATRQSRLYYKEINFLYNPLYETNNPAALAFNKVQTLTTATLEGLLGRGPFHAPDISTKHNDFKVDISGLKQIGKFSLSGNIKYTNAKDYDHRWSNTYMLSDYNPFTLGDTIKSDVNTEEFLLYMGAAYQINDQWTAALKLKYQTGSLSDQTDPRPKTDAMHFTATPGAWFKLSDRDAFGLNADIDVYRSNMSYAILNALIGYNYFLMKGMGDYQRFTTNDVTSYRRDYRGFRFGADAQYRHDFGDMANMLELGYRHNSEKAEDGGSSYTFKAGDYSYNKLTLYDRFSFGTDALRHDITLLGAFLADEGIWYDQQRMVDTEHSNLMYYQVLSKDKIHKSTRLHASLGYRTNKLQDGLPDWNAGARISIANADITHNTGESIHQKYTLGRFDLQGGKFWNIRSLRLETTAGGYYRTTLGTPTFGAANAKITQDFTAPLFEYTTSEAFGIRGHVALSIPVKLYHTPTWVSIYANADAAFYQGDNKYSRIYDGDSRTFINFGVNLTL